MTTLFTLMGWYWWLIDRLEGSIPLEIIGMEG